MTFKNKQQGFTIVELLIVIVVIGILALLVITTFTGIQQKARNTERQTDVKAIHSVIETFYANKGYYPTRTNLNSDTWRGTNLKGLDKEALRDPKNPATDGTQYNLVATPTTNAYSYAVTQSAEAGGGSCESDETTCLKYTLTAKQENGDADFTQQSLN